MKKIILICFIFTTVFSMAQPVNGTITIKKQKSINGFYELEKDDKVKNKQNYHYLMFLTGGVVYKFDSAKKLKKKQIISGASDYMTFAKQYKHNNRGTYSISGDTLRIKFEDHPNKPSYYEKYLCVIKDEERLTMKKMIPGKSTLVVVYLLRKK